MLFPESRSWLWALILAPPGMFSLFGLWYFDERFDQIAMTALFLAVLAVSVVVLAVSVAKTFVDGSRLRTIMWVSFVLALILLTNWYLDLGLLIR